MSDFLKRVRNGNDKRYDMSRFNNPQYINPQFRGGDKQKDKKKNMQRSHDRDALNTLLQDTLPKIKNLLGEISENQKVRIEVEERKAAAFETIAEILKGHFSLPGKNDETSAPEEEVVTREETPQTGEKKVATVPGRKIEPPRPEKKKTALEVVTPDESNREDAVNMIGELRRSGASYNQIALKLREMNMPTFSGKGKWHPQTVQRVCQAQKFDPVE